MNSHHFRLDVEKRRLLCGDEIVPLTPKEFEVLFLLLKTPDEWLKKTNCSNTVWKDTFVEEGTLTRNISWLRKKLAAHGANNLQIIETLPKRGYRFLPEITKSQKPALVVTKNKPFSKFKSKKASKLCRRRTKTRFRLLTGNFSKRRK